MQPVMHSRILMPLLLVALLSGCATELAYHNADWLLVRSAGDYVELTDDQRTRLRARLEERMTWHCRTQLPRYAAFLRAVQAELAGGAIDRAGLRADMDEVLAMWSELMAAMAEDAAAVIPMFSEDQAVALLVGLDERTAGKRETYLNRTPEERRTVERDDMIERLERYFGDLEPRQRERVDRWSRALEPTTPLYLESRVRWRHRFAGALAVRDDRERLEARLRELFVAYPSTWREDYRRRLEHNNEATLALMVDLVNGATDRQRRKLTGKIDALAGDFEKLACD